MLLWPSSDWLDAVIVVLRKRLVVQSPVRPSKLNKRFFVKKHRHFIAIPSTCVLASTTNGTLACKLPECYRSIVPENRHLCSLLRQNSFDVIFLLRLALMQAKLNQCVPRHLNACERIWLIQRRKKNACNVNRA